PHPESSLPCLPEPWDIPEQTFETHVSTRAFLPAWQALSRRQRRSYNRGLPIPTTTSIPGTLMNGFTFSTTRSLVCEPGASARLADYARDLGITRPCLVTDGGIAASGLLEPVSQALSGAGLAVTLFRD